MLKASPYILVINKVVKVLCTNELRIRTLIRATMDKLYEKLLIP